MRNNLLQCTIDHLARLVACDTTSRNSNLPAIDYIAHYLKGLNIEPTVISNGDGSKANLLAVIGPEQEGGILLSGHTDVVPVDGQVWSSNPFTLTEREGNLYGRGTSDMKGFIAVVLALLPQIMQKPLQRPLFLAFTHDEEVGCLGVPSLIHILQKSYYQPRLAIIGEPTELRIINAHKGIYSYLTTVTGVEAHSSAVEQGVSAITLAASLIGFVEELQQAAKEHPPVGAERFSPPYTSYQVGTISGGTAQNIIPGKCQFEWEYRTVPGDDGEAPLKHFMQYAHSKVKPFHKAFPSVNVQTVPTSIVPPLLPVQEEEMLGFLLALSGENAPREVSFGTEAGLYQRAGILSSFICGPGSIDVAHKPDEYVTVEQLEKGLAFFNAVIDKFCFQAA